MYTIHNRRHKNLRDHLAWKFAAKGDAIADMPADRAKHAREVFLFVITEDAEHDEPNFRDRMFAQVRKYPQVTQFICRVVVEYARGTHINRSRLRDLQVAAASAARSL